MPRRLTNDLLLATLLALVLSGVLGWALPQSSVAPLFAVHRALGLALLGLLGWKGSIVVSSLRRRLRRDRSVVWGGLAGLPLLAGVGLGLAWTLNVISFDLLWGYSPMNVHVALGIGLLPCVGWHAWIRRRPNRASAPALSRRALLRLGGLAVSTVAAWSAIEQVAGLLNPSRLPSGSKQTTSFSGNEYPAEIWLLDRVPGLDAAAWRLQVRGPLVDAIDLSLEDIGRLPVTRVRAVLDCTSGWWTEQVWSGAGLLDVLHAHGLRAVPRRLTVTSVTGHRIEFSVEDVREALLATHVGGEVLSPGHGYPVRLVVPGRRGYQWVKWVAEVVVA